MLFFRCSFARKGRLARRSGDLRKNNKNVWFSLVFHTPTLARTLRKSTGNRSEDASRTSPATERVRKTLFSGFQASKWVPRAPRGALGGLLGRLWDSPGRSWAALGALLGGLGGLLGALGPLLGYFWAALGRSWTHPGGSWLDFRLPEGPF